MKTIERDYSGMKVTLTTGSKRKQRLSNNLYIQVPTDSADVGIRLTLRQAKALTRLIQSRLDINSDIETTDSI